MTSSQDGRATSRVAVAISRNVVRIGQLLAGEGLLAVDHALEQLKARIGLGQMVGVDNSAWVTVRTCDDFDDLRRKLAESTHYWWPEMDPMGGTSSFGFAQRMGRLGPVTILDSDFHDDVWVNGGELRPHYH